MRDKYKNISDNNLAKMFNVNRDFLDQEVTRLSSVEYRSAEQINGTGDFGARQMSNYFGGDQGAVVGVSMNSTSVT